jgi:hypothetical protein
VASELVTSGVCPNFVETYQVLRLADVPVAGLWGSPTLRQPQGTLQDFLAARTREAAGGKRITATKRGGVGGAAGGGKRAGGVAGAGAGGGVLTQDAVFIRMELCDGGCAEDFLREIEGGVRAWEDGEGGAARGVDPGAELVLGWTLQMAMSLMACKSRLNMVHGDVKLLNFMLVRNGVEEDGAPKALR